MVFSISWTPGVEAAVRVKTLYTMHREQELKDVVRDRYGKIAEQDKAVNASSCCGATTPSNKVYNIMMDDYTGTKGYVEDADLGLGCGLPTQFARIKKGDTV